MVVVEKHAKRYFANGDPLGDSSEIILGEAKAREIDSLLFFTENTKKYRVIQTNRPVIFRIILLLHSCLSRL